MSACPYCDGDGYTDIVNDWGGVIGPRPCEYCSATGRRAANDELLVNRTLGGAIGDPSPASAGSGEE